MILTTLILLYHNDSFYINFRDKVNARLIIYTNIDVLSGINKIAHLTYFSGKIKAIKHPLQKADIIEIKTKERDKLNSYLKHNPPKKNE